MQSLGRRFLFTRISRLNTFKNTMSTSVPQVRPLTDAGTESPVPKKARLDEGGMARQIAVGGDAMKDGDAVVQQKKLKTNAKKKRRREPPLPEPCSPADVLYREIRELLGEDVVADVTKAEKAFSPPYSRGEQVEVKIETPGSGGELVSRNQLYAALVDLAQHAYRIWYCSCTQGKRSLGDCCALRTSRRGCSRSDRQMGSDALLCAAFGSCTA